MKFMTTLQLVRRRKEHGTTEVDAVVNEREAPPLSFRKGADTPLMLGSEELLVLAQALAREGYRAEHIRFQDSSGHRLADDANRLFEEDVLNIVNHGDAGQIYKFVEWEMIGVYVLAVDLRDRRAGNGIVSLRTHGVVVTHSRKQAESIGRTVRHAMAAMA